MLKSFCGLLLGALLLLTFSTCHTTRPVPPASPAEESSGLSARLQKIRFTDLDGNTRTLQDFAGKPVFLNFWATWCGPCRMEMPDIEQAYQKYKDEIHFLAVSTEDLSKISAYQQNNQLHFDFARLDLDYIEVYVVKLPTTMLIDRTGRLVADEEGARRWMGGT